MNDYNNFEETRFGTMAKRYRVIEKNEAGKRSEVYRLRETLTLEQREKIAKKMRDSGEKSIDSGTQWVAHADGLLAEGLELDRERLEKA